MANIEKTNAQFEQALSECRALFEKKLHDYKASWRILRPTALTDQLFIKAKRIRSLEIKKESLVGEGIRPEFIALINYGIVGLIQLSKGFADTVDMDNQEAMRPGLRSRRTRGDRHSSRVEAKNPALLSNGDGYLLDKNSMEQRS